jgi:hypothetical protein
LVERPVANLTIKDVPPSVHDDLRQLARTQGKSLNAYILSVLEDDVAERARRRRMREAREEFERFLATLPRMSDSAELIREDRDRLSR